MREDATDCSELEKAVAEEGRLQERIDVNGDRWRKVYFGGGEHYNNWLRQARELGEVQVEEVSPKGFKCFEEGSEKLYRIWVKEGIINDPI
jgi:hypothetical protein